MKILVHVTKEILQRSAMCKEQRGENCAIACAVRDIFPRSWTSIFSIDLYLEDRYVIDLPREASDFICQFDNRTPEERVNMEPLSFEIDVPDGVIDEIGIDQAKEIISKSETLELV